MPKYLSEEWAAELASTLNASEEFKAAAAGQDTKIQQVVTDAPGGDVHYYMVFGDGSVDIGLGDLEGAQATISQSYETASAVAKGEMDGQTAFMSGKVNVTGDMMKVMALSGVFQALSKAARSVDVQFD